MKPISTRIAGTSAQLKPVKSGRSWSPRSGKPSERTSSDCTTLAARCSPHRCRRSTRPSVPDRACVSPARSDRSSRPRGCGGRARHPPRLAIRARAMFPMLVPAVLVLVMTTRTPACSSRGRSRSATRRFSSASLSPDTTPWVPPPSLILRVADPGPIGSVAGLARRSWPGSRTTTWGLDRPVAAAGRREQKH